VQGWSTHIAKFLWLLSLVNFTMAGTQYSLHALPQKIDTRRLSRLNGCLPSPKKAIKHVAAIVLSPVKHVEKKRWHKDPDDSDHGHGVAGFFPSLTLDSQSDKSSISTQHSEPANREDDDVFTDASPPPADVYMSQFHQGSMPETPTATPAVYKNF
jgi:hypothetical protein